MKRIVFAALLFATPASALEIKLDDSWVAKLGQLCQAAMYGSRMTAEAICGELESLRVKAASDEFAKRAEDAKKQQQAPQ